MFRMHSVIFCKSLLVGASGARPLTTLAREKGGDTRDRIWRTQIGGGHSNCNRRSPFGAPKTAVTSRSSLVTGVSPLQHRKIFGGASSVPSGRLQRNKHSVMMSATEPFMAPLLDIPVGNSAEMEPFVAVGHKLADAAGEIIRQYFRTGFDIITKDDLSPVTIADRAAEETMSSIIKQHFPSHAIYGEEAGLQMPEGGAEYVWVLDPIDGTKSFITGKPLFGTLIALIHKGIPIFGIIDQPVLRERWVGKSGDVTTLNGSPIASRSSCTSLQNAYLYTTSPQLFGGSKEEAFIRVRNKVKIPLYGCDCYAYGLLAAGHVDLVVESGLKPYDFLALVPVIEGAGGYITDWRGERLRWWPNSDHPSCDEGGTEVVAAGSDSLHKAALKALDWK